MERVQRIMKLGKMIVVERTEIAVMAEEGVAGQEVVVQGMKTEEGAAEVVVVAEGENENLSENLATIKRRSHLVINNCCNL